MIDVTDFLKNGQLLNLMIGLSLQDVEKHLDTIEEDDKNHFDLDDLETGYSVWFNNIELMFIEEKLYGIGVDISVEEVTIINHYLINPSISIEKLITYLDFAKVTWEFSNNETFSKQLGIRTSGGAKFVFIVTHQNEIRLSKIRVF